MRVKSQLLQRVELKHVAVLAVTCLALAAAPFLLIPYALSLLALALTYGLFAFGLDLAWGRAGVISIGHASFFGLGAYGVAIAANNDFSSLAGGLAGIIVAVVTAFAIGLVGLRRSALPSTMAILTLALTLLIAQIAQTWTPVTNGSNGLFVSSQPLVPGFYATAAIVVAAVLVVWLFVIRGNLGRHALAVRSNPQRAEHLGINPSRVRLKMFVLSAAVAAFAGAIAAPHIGLIAPSAAGIVLSTQVLVWLAVGGNGTIAGAFLGAALITIGEQYLGAAIGQWYLLALGIAFVLIVRFAPKGFVGIIRGAPWPSNIAKLLNGSEIPRISVRHKVTGGSMFGESVSVITAQRVAKSFGAMSVISRIDLDVAQGEVICLIGPNGAGKTTFLNMLAGDLGTDAGTITLFGEDVTAWPPYRRNRAGLGRLFQIPSLFLDLSPAENIALARAEADSLVDLPDQYAEFENNTEALAGELPLADRRALEIAVVFAGDPKVVLLDEPAAGLGRDDSIELARTLRLVANTTGCTMIVVEHDMVIVRELADRVVVLVGGTLMFEGSMDDVSNHPEVRRAYLGTLDA
jgi:branched-chain amino acid transport system permease protein